MYIKGMRVVCHLDLVKRDEHAVGMISVASHEVVAFSGEFYLWTSVSLPAC